jgi:hypothetical protein
MDEGAESFAHLGRTRLRIELKKRGLSPSGLKNELLARLEEHIRKQKEKGLPDPGISPLSNFSKGGGKRRGRTKKRNKAKVVDEQQLAKLDYIEEEDGEDKPPRYDEEEEEKEEVEEVYIKQREKSQRKKRGSNDKHFQEKTKSKKRRRATRLAASSSPPPPFTTTASGNNYANHSTSLSGKAFRKEAQHDRPPNSMIKCVERFCFEGENNFRFTYSFWRGKALRHRFEIEGGTFSFYSFTYSQDGDIEHSNFLSHVELNSESRMQPKTKDEILATESQQLLEVSVPTEPSISKQCPSLINTTDMEKLNTLAKVILHWPSSIHSASLKAWQFDKTYPHLLVIFPPATSLSTVVNSSQPLNRKPILVSKHNGVFVQEGKTWERFLNNNNAN